MEKYLSIHQSIDSPASKEVFDADSITYKFVGTGTEAEIRLNRAFDLLFEETLRVERTENEHDYEYKKSGART